jgi:glycosyltransferase involved in cell wall biosynthesis
MVLHDPQEIGGLEEYAATLAISLERQGQEVSVLSTTWVPLDNQYIRRLTENGVMYIQVPKWLSRPASHWPTKQRILEFLMRLVSPVTIFLAICVLVYKRSGWRQAWISAHGWLRGQLQTRIIEPNCYKPLSRLLLNWWRLRWNPDLLHIQGYTRNLLFVIEWAYKKKIPVVYEEHQTPDAQFDWWQGFQNSINKATIVVAVSQRSADGLREVCNVTQPIVVRNPLLPDPLASGWTKDGRSLQENQSLHISTVARLNIAKGLSYLLEAIVQVKKLFPSTQLKIYGDGSLRNELLVYANRIGLDGEEIFVGSFTNRQELTEIMADTDIFVMSSILEGQPLSLVEAMAYGCPIVATSVGGIPELIKNGVNGLLCLPKDPMCLAQKIISLIENPAMRIKLGQAARLSYEQGPFQPAAVSNHFLSIYQEAIDLYQQNY